jgi:hypothetical protein
MTTQLIVKEYNDNKTIKISPKANIEVYKCPFLHCDEFFFSRDDLDQHRIRAHAVLPKSFTNVVIENKNKRYFNRNTIYSMNSKIQRENLKHVLMILNIDIESIRKPLYKKIKEWLNARRNRSKNNG